MTRVPAAARRAPAPLSRRLLLSRLGGSVALASLALLTGCDAKASEEVSIQDMDWPEGTVLVLDEYIPVTVAEVDYWNEGVLLVEPGSSLNAQRRYSLTNTVLPQKVASSLDVATREEVLTQAQEYFGLLRADAELPATAPTIEEVPDGYWKFLGLDIWQLARHVPLGEWQLEETIGAYILFRVVERDAEPWSHLSKAWVERIILPYLDGQLAAEVIQQALDQTQIDIIDDQWEEIVPARYQY